jgi:hypothetical protein
MEPNTQSPENNEKPETTTTSIIPVAPSKSLQMSIVFGSIIVGVAIVGATYLYTQSLKIKEPTDLTQTEEDSIWRPEQDFNNEVPYDASTTDDSLNDVPVDHSETNDGSSNTFLQQLEKNNIAQYDLAVSWLPRPVKAAFSEIPYTTPESFTRIYRVGTITNGVLSNTPVYLMYESDMGSDYGELYAINTQSVVRVREWIKDVSGQPSVIEDTISKLKLTKDKDKYSLGAALIDLEGMAANSGAPIKRLAVNSSSEIPDGELYQYRQCFFARTPSDLLVEYTVDVPFIDNETEGGYGTPNISFTRIDGTKMSGEYEIYDRVNYGCGSLCSPLKVVERPDSDFVKTGTTPGGYNLFVLKNSNDVMLTDLYNQPNTRAFVDTTEGRYEPLKKNKYSYEQFLSMAPILFWKDQLGRWVRFVHSEFLILAEKCKPVIYLYPEKETDLHVEVKPNVGFTKTIPEYKDGWNVTAYPDGTIIDKKSQEKFDYLYWTGWVEGYPLIEQGWVVAQKDLPAFFDVYLPKYGLVGKEIEDFKEYWEDDMNEAPYYAVSFVDQAVIDKLSPLSLDATPDTVIRVLMTAMPLERPIKLHAPRIPETPVRHGFTVAEWGGTILRTE